VCDKEEICQHPEILKGKPGECSSDPATIPMQGHTATIEVFPEYVQGLFRIEAHSHLYPHAQNLEDFSFSVKLFL